MRGIVRNSLIALPILLGVLYIAAPDVDDKIYKSRRGEVNDVPGPLTSERIEVEVLELEVPVPWDLEFLPNGDMLVTSRNGGVYRFDGKKSTQVLALMPHVVGHAGLMGMAIDPLFEENSWVYLLYTYESTGDKEAVRNRVARYRLEKQQLVFEQIILNAIPGSFEHAGGGLEFGPDGALYATTGDADEPERAADITFLGGKILRMDRDGNVPPDNPIRGSLVYTMGHRNPQGLAWQPKTGVAFNAEHGAFNHDEVNRLIPGANYGWNGFACDKHRVHGLRRMWFRLSLWLPESITSPNQDVEMPVYCSETWNMAPSQMTFVDDPEHPWYGDLFVGSLVANHLRRFEVSEEGKVLRSELFFPQNHGANSSRIRDVEFHSGALYLLGDSEGLSRLSPAG